MALYVHFPETVLLDKRHTTCLDTGIVMRLNCAVTCSHIVYWIESCEYATIIIYNNGVHNPHVKRPAALDKAIRIQNGLISIVLLK